MAAKLTQIEVFMPTTANRVLGHLSELKKPQNSRVTTS